MGGEVGREGGGEVRMATCGRRSSTQRGKEGGKKILKIYGDVSVLERNGRQNAFRAHARLREEKKGTRMEKDGACTRVEQPSGVASLVANLVACPAPHERYILRATVYKTVIKT